MYMHQKNYEYKKAAAEHAAFRNYLVLKKDSANFHRIFFIDNDNDESGLLPDKTPCWVALVNALAELFPSKEFHKSFSGLARCHLKSVATKKISKEMFSMPTSEEKSYIKYSYCSRLWVL